MARKKNGWVREEGRWVLYENGKRSRSQIQTPSSVTALGRRLKRLPQDMTTVARRAAKDIKSSAKNLTYQDNQSSGSPRTKAQGETSSNSKSSSSKPKYPTSAVTKTVKKGRDYQAEAKAKAAAGFKPKSKPSIKEAAYAKDSRNREYDRLRKAGKTKEAEALGRKIAGMKPKEVKETQKRTGGSRIANITLPKKSISSLRKAQEQTGRRQLNTDIA